MTYRFSATHYLLKAFGDPSNIFAIKWLDIWG